MFSPTVNSDPAWGPVIKYMKDELNQENKAEHAYSRITTRERCPRSSRVISRLLNI